MFEYLFRYRKHYFIGAFLLLIVNLLAAYIPQLIKNSIDSLATVNVNQQLLLIVLLSILMAIARIFSRQVLFGAGRSMEFDLKKEIFAHLLSLDIGFFQKHRTGDLLSIITNDVQSMRALAGFAVLNVINTILAFGIVIPLMFQINGLITIVFTTAIPVILFFIFVLSKEIKRYQEIVQVKLGELSNFLEENLSAIHIIKAYAQEEPEIKRFEEYNQGLKNSYLKLIEFRSFMSPIMRVITSLGLLILISCGGRFIIDGTLSQGEFAAYLLYIYRLIWPISTLGWLITVIYRSQVSYKRIHDILSTQSQITNQPNAICKYSFDKEIQFQGHKIPKGIKLAIVGAVASGKSIIAAKSLRLMEPAPGEVLIDGIDVGLIDLDSLRVLVGLVPQEAFLFPVSVAQNIAYGKDLDIALIEKLADLVQIKEEINKLPNGFNSVVGERGVSLSGGQRQRIAIARALALDPEILFLDDSLSHLDSNTSDLILKSIYEYRKSKTTILITHKLSQVQDFDLIWVVNDSKILESGSHANLLAIPNSFYRRLWEGLK